MPETPDFKRLKYAKLGLSEKQIEVIIANVQNNRFFEEALLNLPANTDVKLAANYFTTDMLSLLGESELSIENADPKMFIRLIQLVSDGKITSRVAKDLLKETVFDGEDPVRLATDRGLMQQNSAEALDGIVAQIIAENETVVAEYKAGKEASIQYLVGQGMKATKGSANPTLLKELLENKIKG